MGNLCCQEMGMVPGGSTAGVMEVEVPEIYKNLVEFIASNPKADIAQVSINKNFLRYALDSDGKVVPQGGGDSAPIFSEFVRLVEGTCKKKFIPIQVQNDPVDQAKALVVLANANKLSRFDLIRRLGVHEFTYYFHRQHITLGDSDLIEGQLLNVIRELYETKEMYVVGGYQDSSSPSTFVFMLIKFILEKHETPKKKNSPYFLHLHSLKEGELESFLCETEYFIQGLLQVRSGDNSFIYALCKDPEVVDINDSIVKIDIMDESFLKDYIIQYNQDIQNLLFTNRRTYLVSNINQKREKPVEPSLQQKESKTGSSHKQSYSSKGTSQNIQVVEEKKDEPAELVFQEPDKPESFLLEFQKTRGPYKVIDTNAETGELVVFKLAEFAKIKLKNDIYFYSDYEVPNLDQVQIKNSMLSKISEIKQALRLSVEYLGAADHWKVYKTLNRGDNAALFVSLQDKAIPNCMREVHFYKKFISKDEFYGKEYVVKNKNNQVVAYAVEVAQPLMSLYGLKTIWQDEELSGKKNESKSFEKLIYILFQVLTQIRNMQYQNIYHGSIDAHSIFIDLRTYKVKLGNLSMIGQEAKDNELVGIIKGQDQNLSPKQNDIESVKNLFRDLLIELEFTEVFGDVIYGLSIDKIDEILSFFQNQGIEKLVQQFVGEEKDLEALRTMKYDTLQPINHLIEVEQESDLLEDKNFLMQTMENSGEYVSKMMATQKFFATMEPKDALQQVNLSNLSGNALIFGYIQDLVLKGETEFAIQMLEELQPVIEKTFDIFSVYLNIIQKDLNMETYQLEEEASLEELPNIQQLCLLVINSSDKEHFNNADATLIDLYNSNHPLSQVIQSIRNKEQIISNKFLPQYFINRLNINHQLKGQEEAGKVELGQALSLFKAIKNAVHLMLYHDNLTHMGQYTSEDPYFELSLFLKDLFNRDFTLHQEAKKVLSEALKVVANEDVCDHVIGQLCRTKASDVYRSHHYKMSPVARMNFFIKEFVFEFNAKGKQQIADFMEANFKREYYIYFQNQLLENNEFMEFLAMFLGVVESDTDKFRKFQLKFKA